MKKILILASSSPRRSEILRRAGFRFRVVAPRTPESRIRRGEAMAAYSMRLAEAKAREVMRRTESARTRIILAADTLVFVGRKIFGKPHDREEARAMLQALSGRAHRVITGVCLISVNGRETRVRRAAATSAVQFAKLSPKEIDAYLQTREPLDKAGAYAVQGLASKFVTRIEGCYFNVMGLPMALVYRLLKRL